MQKYTIFLHVLFRLALLSGVGFLSYIVILDGRDDTMGFGAFYAIVFTIAFTIVFGLVDSILLYVKKKYRKFKANMIMFGVLALIILGVFLFQSK